MRRTSSAPWYAEEKRGRYLVLAAMLVAIIAIADLLILPDVGFDFLYFIPIILASAFLSRWQIAFLALICGSLRDLFVPATPEKWPRMVAVYAIYLFVGLFVREMVVHRRAAQRHLRDLESEIKRCQQSEEELQKLINSSPVAIVTISSEGNIVRSNTAAHRVFGVSPGGLSGQALVSYVPEFPKLRADTSLQSNGTAFECHCRRADGEGFAAHVWLSNNDGETGSALIAFVASGSGKPQ